MNPTHHTMQVFELAPLKQKALLLLGAKRRSSITLAVDLAVPLFVADDVLFALQSEGEALPFADGWGLTASATARMRATGTEVA